MGAFAIIMAIPAIVSAQATGGDTDNGAVSGVTSGDTTNGAVSNTSTGTPPPVGATGGDDTNGAVSAPVVPPSTGGDDINGAVSVPVTPIVTPPGGGGSSSGSYGGGSSSSGGSSIYYPQLLAVSSGTSTCPLITTYMKLGQNNDVTEVVKLQSFLKNSQGMNLTVNGIFDGQTDDAVRAFQVKYLSTIMGPWDATQSSGFVYITTQKKINELACSEPFVLSESDQAIIDAYKSRLASGQPAVDSGSNTTGPVLETGSGASSTVPLEVGTNAGGSQTASVVNPSIISRFWNFIIGLFK